MLHKRISLAEEGLEDLAWTRPDVIGVVMQLDGTKVAVIGGDILKNEGEMYGHTCDSWCCDIRPGELWDEYAKRSRKTAQEYVEAYPEAHNSSYIFCLLLADKPSIDQLLKIHSTPVTEHPSAASKPKKSWLKIFWAFSKD